MLVSRRRVRLDLVKYSKKFSQRLFEEFDDQAFHVRLSIHQNLWRDYWRKNNMIKDKGNTFTDELPLLCFCDMLSKGLQERYLTLVNNSEEFMAEDSITLLGQDRRDSLHEL